MLIYLDVKIPHLQIAHFEVGYIKIRPSLGVYMLVHISQLDLTVR